ncbi:hypothetical protein [Streptomyces chengmaiensis]|uniref:hypothetical protein n=1 Tax=Streptomyces chengmaiensis TaxID=3040919 RepID=UPI002448633A|nr:hypothetical protein [Streptomyces chengmaiensis]
MAASLDRLPIQEFLFLYRACLDQEDGAPSLEISRFEDRRDIYLEESMDSYIGSLSTRHPERAKEIFFSFAGSPLKQERHRVAHLARPLMQVDHDIAIDLWERLLRDPEHEVRAKAFDEMEDALEDPELTPADIFRLTNAYHEAEQDENLHDPVRHAGELALRRLVSLMDSENES